MDGKKKAVSLMATAALMSTAIGGPYFDDMMRIPAGKPRRGTLVGCHVCRASNVTLYKDGDLRICGECRKKREEVQDDQR